MKRRTELANHLNEVIILKGKFATIRYDKKTTFKKLINVETNEKTDHINVKVPKRKYEYDKIYTIIGVVTVYRTNDEREFDFCLNLVTVEE